MLLVLACQLPTAWAGSLPPSVAVHDATNGRRNLPAMADLLAPRLRDGTTVLAIVPDALDGQLESQLLALRSAFDTTRLVVHTTALPPLASTLLVRMLGELAMSRHVVPSLLVSGVGRLEQLITSVAWLGSVARLQRPAPSLLQHARSWLPGSRFAAVLDDEPRVLRLRRNEPLPLDRLDPPEAWRIVVTAGTGDQDAVERSLAHHAPGVEVTRIPRADESVRWWGTERFVEVAYVPSDVRRWARQLLGDREPGVCRWCGELSLVRPCSLCHEDSAPATAAEVPA